MSRKAKPSPPVPDPEPLALPGRLAEWFTRRGWEPFTFQREAWAAHAAGESGLVHAPTGYGKTLAVWLGPLAAALEEAEAATAAGETPPGGCQILWITPLRALAQDTAKALSEPVAACGQPGWSVETRTGDTPASRRARQKERLPFALVTTPESLSLLISYPGTRAQFTHLRAVIVDEWHELLGSKRGVQTELCLARLRQWCPGLRVWGLSATLGNLDEALQALIGPEPGRPGRLISGDLKKEVVLETLLPREMEHFPWSGHLGTRLVHTVAERVKEARTTLVFTNTRSQVEIWCQELAPLLPEGDLAVHHGSLDRKDREEVENALRTGSVRCVICTSSLDLGVDFAPVDQVIHVGSPKGIARLLQRAGRSGHSPGQTSRILCVPTNALELVDFAAARDALARREIERRRPLRRPLDVLTQHLVTCVLGEPCRAEDLRAEVCTTHAYAELNDTEWEWALGFITHGGRALHAYPHYRKVVEREGWLSVPDADTARRHRLAIGTITSDAAIAVKYAGGRSLGTVEEGFISRLKPGKVFVFAGRKLELVRFHQQTATVRNATKNHKGEIVTWSGAKMSLSTELAHAVARRLRGEGPPAPEMRAFAPLLDIQARWSAVPTDDVLLVEFTRTREGEHLFVFPFAGRLVHEGLGSLVAHRLSRETGEPVHITMNDYGFGLAARGGLHLDEAVLRAALTREHLLEDLVGCLNTAELARRQFREIARVAGLLMPDYPGKRRKLREVQTSASLLYEVFDRYDPGNLLLEQSRREIFEKQLELTRLDATLAALEHRPMKLIETERLTPMAFPLWAERLHAFHPGADAATRLEKMLLELEQAAGERK